MENKKVFLREQEKSAIKYMNKVGATDAIGIFKKVGENGKVDESKEYYQYGTICLANKLEKSDKNLILTDDICEKLTDIYKKNKHEISFMLGGYISGDCIHIKDIYFQKKQEGTEEHTPMQVDFVQKSVLKTKIKYLLY